jgi:hypothetical protein
MIKTTAEEFLKNSETYDDDYPTVSIADATNAMIEFAKLHIKSVMELQMNKYYAGETGYIIKEEWNEILKNIK